MLKGFIVLSFLFISSNNYQDGIKLEDRLIGVWVSDTNQRGESIYRRSQKFLHDRSGVEFKDDGKLLFRSNSGWCGTPPITYAKFEGSWKLLDSTLIISNKYWGGDMKQVWEIISVTPTILTVKNYGSITK